MIKVLVVDDKTENIYLLQSMLDTYGFKTISAKNGAEALGLMRTVIPDLIIADILMPVMDGFTLCRECKKDEILKNIPFFFYTATYIDAKDEEYALSLGADRFILKPQEPDVFLKIINDFLEEVERKTIHPREVIQPSETVVLKEYNEVLIRKIEDKMLQTEKSEKELKKYAEKLEKEIDERKKNEESLLKSEEYNRLLFTTSPIGLALCKMNGSLVDINPAYARIIGRTIEETLQLNYWDITPEKYFTQEEEQLKNLEETGHYGKYEKEYIHKDGHLVPVILQGLILERDGERLIWSTVEDISERKKAEIALRESQHLFQTLSQVSPVGIFRTTSDGNTTYVNPKWSELSGLSQEEALGYGWLNALHPEDRVKLSESWIKNLKSQNESNAEYRFVRRDKSIVWVLGKAVPEMNGNELAGYIGTITDITERKLTEEALQISEKQLSTIYRTIGDVIYYLAIETEGIYRFISVSQTFYNVTGLSPEMIIGKLVTEVIPEPSLSNVLGKYMQAIEEKTIIRWEETSEYPTGKLIGEVSITPVVDNNGLCTHLVGSVHDITKMKLSEEELIKAKDKAEETDRLKTAFLTNMSHEIRTPMNGILGFAELLKEPSLTTEEQQEFIKTIGISAERMLSTINSIVDISKIEAGMVSVDINETNISDKMLFTYKFFKPEVESKGLTLLFKCSLPTNESIIKTDNEKVYAILTNLVKNAIKFTHQGSIEFGYKKKGEYLEFYVNDTGIGIPENQKGLIFERFRQGSESNIRGYEGSGLGLSICKSYVEMLGGRIWVESEEGLGSTFYFTIPYNQVSEEINTVKDVSSEEHKDVQLKNLKILIVEDDEISYSLLTRTIQKISKEVLHAITGVEAVEACRNNQDLDLVLMDIRMPQMNGLEATQQIRQFNKDLIIIAQTAYGFSSDCEKALKAGCNDYITKPINKTLLFELIKKHCNK
jgi:PAS domain S-box-containing protein